MQTSGGKACTWRRNVTEFYQVYPLTFAVELENKGRSSVTSSLCKDIHC